MTTHLPLRVTGALALATAALLTGALALMKVVPVAARSDLVSWYALHAARIEAGAALWLFAMLGMVVFAVAFRDVMWLAVADRTWVTVLLLQGVGLFALLGTTSAAIGWTLATQAGVGGLNQDVAAVLWSLEHGLLRFAAVTCALPLAALALSLHRHSVVGQAAAGTAALTAGGLFLPATWAFALCAVPGCLLMVGLALLISPEARPRSAVRDEAAAVHG
jgi:hypothetical protein